jgi:hypothetical protein
MAMTIVLLDYSLLGKMGRGYAVAVMVKIVGHLLPLVSTTTR